VGSGIASRLAVGDLDPILAQDMNQAASLLITDFMTTLAVIQDQKIEPVLGATPDEAKPGIAEARLSGLTMPMILANLDGLLRFNAALEGAVGPLHRKSWDALLKRLQSEAHAMQDFPDGVTDPAKRRSIEAFLGRLKAVRAVLKDDLPVMLGLKLGFNGLDGD
jgi:predicted lipoprotein